MNFMQKQLSAKMIDAVRGEIRKLDKDSPFLKALKTIDIDKVLTEDIDRLCEDISMGEMMKILPLIVKVKAASAEGERALVHGQIREIALKIVERVECKGGRLSIPASCRDLLLEL